MLLDENSDLLIRRMLEYAARNMVQHWGIIFLMAEGELYFKQTFLSLNQRNRRGIYHTYTKSTSNHIHHYAHM